MKMPEASPSGKKLKQARLSFGAPVAQPSPPKKPRIETEEMATPEPVREILEESIAISDDEPSTEKVLNPLTSLVDVALKRKLNKRKPKKKKKTPKVEEIQPEVMEIDPDISAYDMGNPDEETPQEVLRKPDENDEIKSNETLNINTTSSKVSIDQVSSTNDTGNPDEDEAPSQVLQKPGENIEKTVNNKSKKKSNKKPAIDKKKTSLKVFFENVSSKHDSTKNSGKEITSEILQKTDDETTVANKKKSSETLADDKKKNPQEFVDDSPSEHATENPGEATEKSVNNKSKRKSNQTPVGDKKKTSLEVFLNNSSSAQDTGKSNENITPDDNVEKIDDNNKAEQRSNNKTLAGDKNENPLEEFVDRSSLEQIAESTIEETPSKVLQKTDNDTGNRDEGEKASEVTQKPADEIDKTKGNKAKRKSNQSPASAKKTPQERMMEKIKRETERAKKLEEKLQREQEKQERSELKKQEKEEREKLKEEMKQKRETSLRFKQMIKETQEKKKEEKEEQKRKYEEMKDEQKKLKELEKEKVENKKKKAAAAFEKHFILGREKAKNNEGNSNETEQNHSFLSNFSIKTDMRLAPSWRNNLNEETKLHLDNVVNNQCNDKSLLYLNELKGNVRTPMTMKKTWPLEDLKNDLIIIEDDLPPIDDAIENNQVISNGPSKTYRAKLYSFCENRRPPYWGTWRRKSPQVTGRKPFAMDKTFLDYTCDSDEEWEEEEPGESVESIAGSDAEESENEYDVDNDFMVPHGYLSDEEMLGDDDNDISPETQQAKLKFLEHEFEDEMKKPTKIKQPRLIGIVWQNSDCNKPDSCRSSVWNFLLTKSILSVESSIVIHASNENDFDIDEDKKELKKKKKISDELIPDLIKLVHGNTHNRGFLVKEFQLYIGRKSCGVQNEESPVCDVSQVSIARKIKEISSWMPCPDEGPMHSRMCWFVSKDIRENYGLCDLTLPNEWIYALVPKSKKEKTEKRKEIEKKESPPKKESPFNIMKFAKILTDEDKEKQFSKSANHASSDEDKNAQNVSEHKAAKPEKKRVTLLFSGPRGVALLEKTSLTSIENKPPKDVEDNKSDVKKKVSLVTLDRKNHESPKMCKANLLTQFIKSATVKYAKDDLNDECVVLSD